VSKVFVVIAEAPADFAIATELADRVLCEQVVWLEVGLLDTQRTWMFKDPAGHDLSWAAIKKSADKLRIPTRGRFQGKSGEFDAKAARRAIRYVLKVFQAVDAIVLIRDLDDQPTRRDGLKQARNEHESEPPIVIGAANPERECWVLSGFETRNDAEAELLKSERQMLGFCPCERSHELTDGKDDTRRKSPKRVLRVLTRDDPERQRVCWMEMPLERLRERGQDSGLSDYLKEVQSRLVPLIDPHAGRTTA